MLAPRLEGKSRAAVAVGGLALAAIAIAIAITYRATRTWRPDIPRVWDEAALAGWATPLAGLGQAPTHMSAAGLLRDPRRKPAQLSAIHAGSRTGGLLGATSIRRSATADRAREARHASGLDRRRRARVSRRRRAQDVRSPGHRHGARAIEAMQARGTGPLPDGTINGLRWVPTKAGVAVGLTNCSACHLLYLPDDTAVPGASSFAIPNNFRNGLGSAIRAAERTLPGEVPFALTGSIGEHGLPGLRRAMGPRSRRRETCEKSPAPSSTPTSARESGAAAWRAGTAASSIPPRSPTSSASRIGSTSTIPARICTATSATSCATRRS